jgi:hypothetical protein
MRSLRRLPAYVVGVSVVWAAIFAIGALVHGPTPGHPVLHVFGGFVAGMASMYIATRLDAWERANSGPASGGMA